MLRVVISALILHLTLACYAPAQERSAQGSLPEARASFTAAPTSQAGPKDGGPAVILISVDGLAHFYFDDPKAPMPAMRQLAADGVHAAGGMRASMPTVTWPNHTTLVTGVEPAKHGVIANDYLDRATRKPVQLVTDPIFEKDQLVKAPTIYDVAHAAGMSTAAVIWPASRGSKTLDWTVPDVISDKLFQDFGSSPLLTAAREAHIPYEQLGKWSTDSDFESRDRMDAALFKLILDRFHPRLALLHLINVDHMEHQFGPQTQEAYDAIKLADQMVAQVRDEARQAYSENVTIFVCSDHGFYPFRQLVLPNVMLRQAGLLEVKGERIVSARVQALSQGGCSFVYLLDSPHHDELLKQVTWLFNNAEGVEKVIGPGELAKFGMADPKIDSRMADLVLCAKAGYAFSNIAAGERGATAPTSATKGAHGYDRDLPAMYATFIAEGSGVLQGAKLDRVDNTRVAPTIARLLHLRLSSSDAEPLSIFSDDQKDEASTRPSGVGVGTPAVDHP